ncbi:MAG TPA: PHP domain-containing protein, partial [Candidatus Blautia avicola]|nr:PHP domain-containing protein [Candidatus Blautia avicola]
MYCDYHLHSSFSGDSEVPMEEMIQKGIQLGLPAMCFTEHLDPDFPEGDYSFDLD